MSKNSSNPGTWLALGTAAFIACSPPQQESPEDPHVIIDVSGFRDAVQETLQTASSLTKEGLKQGDAFYVETPAGKVFITCDTSNGITCHSEAVGPGGRHDFIFYNHDPGQVAMAALPHDFASGKMDFALLARKEDGSCGVTLATKASCEKGEETSDLVLTPVSSETIDGGQSVAYKPNTDPLMQSMISCESGENPNFSGWSYTTIEEDECNEWFDGLN